MVEKEKHIINSNDKRIENTLEKKGEEKQEVNTPRNAYKIVLLGDSTVGKTTFHGIFKGDEFKEEHTSTYGMEVQNLKTEFEHNKIGCINIWDTPGQDRFKSLTKSYFKNGCGFIIMYDITNSLSFENLASWIKDIEENANGTYLIMIIGNKIDLEDKREVTQEKGQSFADKLNYLFAEISCKTNTGINEAVIKLVQQLYLKFGSNCKFNDSGKTILQNNSNNRINTNEKKANKHNAC